eukprot:TRINITY_DN6458_c0_g1_i2.p1 TRINITY_DN6458_c0_g1~~TRINITY_DN6458_c0_g1_i2.p1  ORF type:complete len:324 (-),score=55.72 TRINITY_DN6458_c0_g1_i2:360-1331(-)
MQLTGKQSDIAAIFITHLHGDHVYGLPGLLCHLAFLSEQKDRTIEIFGPVGIASYLRNIFFLTTVSEDLPPIRVTELSIDQQDPEIPSVYKKLWLKWKDKATEDNETRSSKLSWKGTTVYSDTICDIVAVPIYHTIPCIGYVFKEKESQGNLLVEKLVALGIPPGPSYKQIKNGDTSLLPPGVTLDQVVLEKTKGRKIVILGDTNDPRAIVHQGKDCDLLVHESTFSSVDRNKAISCGHSSCDMAAKMASFFNASNLILTHFSARYDDQQLEEMKTEASKLFSGEIFLAHDFMVVDFPQPSREAKGFFVDVERSRRRARRNKE